MSNRYFDNASTSYPKPLEVVDGVREFLTNEGGTYGRASYGRVHRSTMLAEECRDLIAEVMGVESSDNIFFSFNATTATNTIIQGFDFQGKRVLVSPLEHNCIMRPLTHLEQQGKLKVEVLPHTSCGKIDIEALQNIDTDNIALIIINHQSNVNGIIQPIEDICHWSKNIAPVMVDLAQSLGTVDVFIDKWGVDFAVWTAHKSLYGTTGVGGFFARNPKQIEPLLYGGTGSRSDSLLMPEIYPDRFEAGTPNMLGIVALKSALENKPSRQHTHSEFMEFMCAVKRINGVKVYCSEDRESQGELFSFNHINLSTAYICDRLFKVHHIECRQGLHCSPLAHRTLDTIDRGTVRVAPSAYHTKADFDMFLSALINITNE